MKLKKLFLLIILVGLCLSIVPTHYRSVHFVYDGDTILLNGGDKVRYLGIDAPEIEHNGGKSEFMAHAARNFNIKLVKGARVKLEYDQEKRDKYGRHLAYVFLENGDMVNALLLRKGLAHVLLYSLNVKYKTLLLDCQRKAMRERLGIWRKSPKKEGKYYLGNRSSYRFHRPSCPFGGRISQSNSVRFRSRYDAFWAGYSPCKRCRP